MVQFFPHLNIDGIWKQIVSSFGEDHRICHPIALQLLLHYNWEEQNLRNALLSMGVLIFKEVGIVVETTTGDCTLCEMAGEPFEGKGTGFCAHTCTPHLKDWLVTQVEKGATRLSCYKEGCGIQFPYTSLPETILSQYDSNVNCDFILRREFKPCPSSRCYYLSEPDDSFLAKMEVSCLCGNYFCSLCTLPVHYPALCEDMRRWNARIPPGNKPCPGCGHLYFKDGGCQHMICITPGCRTEFCWFCLGLWSYNHICQVAEMNDEMNNDRIDECVLLHQELDKATQKIVCFRSDFLYHPCPAYLRSLDEMLRFVNLRKFLAIYFCFNPMIELELAVERENMEGAFRRVMDFYPCDMTYFDRDGLVICGKMHEVVVEFNSLLAVWEDLYREGPV